MKKLFLSILAITIGSIGWSQSNYGYENFSFTGKWNISAINLENSLVDMVEKNWEIEFNPNDGRVYARLCNRLFGGFSFQKDQLVFGTMAGTKMYCSDNHIETALIKALSETDRASYRNNKMFLQKGNEVLMVLQRS